MPSPEMFKPDPAPQIDLPPKTAAELARQKDHAYFAEEFRLTGPIALSPEQIETNRRGRQLALEALAKHRRGK